MYCTYLTIYSGNKLPPFYIGYTSEQKIIRGYHGSVKSKQYNQIWKDELRERPELFKTIIIKNGLTKENANNLEIHFLKKLQAVRNPLYINKAAFPCFPDMKPWNKGSKGKCKPNQGSFQKGQIPWNKNKKGYITSYRGAKLTEEHKQKLSQSKKGKIPWNKGKYFVMKEQKLPLKGRTYEEIYGVIRAQQLKKDRSIKMMGNKNSRHANHKRKDSHWYTNTIEDKMFLPTDTIPENFFKGRRSKNVKNYQISIVPITQLSNRTNTTNE